MVARKQIINPRYGQTFHSIREERGLPLAFFKDIVSKATLDRFEKGESVLAPEKLEEALKLMDLSMFTYLYLADNMPVYRRYGEVFQLLREQRGYELESFENIEINAYTLEKFEAGKVMLDFDKVDAALQMMHVPLYEFSHILDKGEDDYFSEIFAKVDMAYYAEDWGALRIIYEEAIPYDDFRLIAFAAKACYEKLSEEEIEEVSDFLFGVDIWTNMELFVLQYTVGQLAFSLLRSVWVDLLKDVSLFEDNRDYRMRVVRTGAATCFAMIDLGNLSAARQFLDLSENLLRSTDEFTRCVYKFAQNLVIYKQGKQQVTTENCESAQEKMKKVIEIFDFLGDKTLAQKFQNLYDRYVE
ncbi:hypothetical protein ACFO26_01165 [Lactococcus nasutitermitis]|uniref:HTH-type transcriptional regulator Rgg C-terminal domain-containing protein n=1 Tax=Lactococcus nasutitermitis TaxID=1652957 RepID=A0ABV9JC13_9LACT|nr:hypothetical protein [Lactococcus nasutitermitis]